MNASRSSGRPAGAGSHSPSSKADPYSTSLQPSFNEPRESPFSNEGSRSAGSRMGEAASFISGDVKEAAKTATRAVKEQASQLASDVGHELSKTAEQQKTRGVEAIHGFARAITAAASELERQSPHIAQYVREAAHRVEGLSSNISGRDVQELMKAASDLARSQPLLFIGGAVAAGFALSRFLKSSAKSDEIERQPSTPDLAPI